MSNHAKNQSVTKVTLNQSVRTPEGGSITLTSDRRIKRTAIRIARTLFPSYFNSKYGRTFYADRRQYGVRYKTVRNGFHSSGQDVCNTLNDYYKCNDIHAVAYRWGSYNNICIAVKAPWQSTERFYKQFAFINFVPSGIIQVNAKAPKVAKVSDNPAIAILKKHINAHKQELKSIKELLKTVSRDSGYDMETFASLAKDGVDVQNRIDSLQQAYNEIEKQVTKQVNTKNIYGNYAKRVNVYRAEGII